MEYNQGDILKIDGLSDKLFIIVSTNAFIKATGAFHVCPFLSNIPEGPLHISVRGKNNTFGTVICEQIKLIDPSNRNCNKYDYISYEDLMNISDTIQGLFEYD